MRKSFEVIVTVLIVISLGVFSSFQLWKGVFFVGEIINEAGIPLKLVGSAEEIDLGAVISSIVFFSICAIFTTIFHLKKKSHVALSVLVSGFLVSAYIFVLVSSLIHF